MRVRSLRARVTLGPNMPTHAHAKKKSMACWFCEIRTSTSYFIYLYIACPLGVQLPRFWLFFL